MNSVAALPPIITTQPANQTVPVGGNATFVVAANSGSTLSYQWYFQGSRIPGATSSSYTRTNAQLTDAGAYHVALTNADGWAISSNAILTVLPTTSTTNAIWRSSGDTSPNVAAWNGTTFGAAGNTAAVGQWRIIDGAEAPTRDEAIIVGVNAAGAISGEMFSGGAWSALPFTLLSSGAPSDRHGFDVAYESASGGALLVWNNLSTGTNNVTYRVWNGSNWSAALTVPATLAGSATEIKLAADPYSDTILMQVCNAASDDYAIVWNGSNWTKGITVGTATSLEPTDAAIAVETPSGHALSVYDDFLAGNILDYRTWNGDVWSAADSIAAPAGVVGDPKFVSLTSDPNSSRVALAVLTSSSEIWFALWDGYAWGSQVLATAIGGSAACHNTAVAFEGENGQLIATYGKSGSTAVQYRTWTSAGGWSAELAGPTIGAVANAMTLTAEAGSDRLMLAVQDANRDLHYVPWDGNAWGARNTLDLNTGETTCQPFLFLVTASINTSPIAQSQSVSTPQDTAKAITLSGRDLGNNPLTFSIVSDPANGVLSGVNTNTGAVTYTPNTNFNGADSFTFRVNNGTTNSAVATVSITVLPPTDVATTVSGPAKAFAGTNFTYTITVTNLGPVTGSNLVVSDVLPAGVTFVSASGGGISAGGVVNWTIASLASAAASNFTVTVTAPPIGTLTNTVSSTAANGDPNAANNNGSSPAATVITTITPVANVITTKSGPASVFAATNFTYTIAVTNLGPSTASNLIVGDRLPAGIPFVSASGGGTMVGGGPGQVVFDRASSTISTNNTSGVLTWTHVTTNTANRLMLVGVSFGNSGATTNSAVTALTYGGVNLTKVLAATNNLIVSGLWQLVNPPSGTNMVALTFFGAPSTVVAGAVTFSGVDLATPLSATSAGVGKAQGGTKITSFTLNSASNEIVFDNLTISKNRNPIAATDQTELWNIGGAEIGAASIKPGTNSATLSWTAPQTVDWIDLAASVKAAPLIGLVNWTIPSLASGASTNFTVTVTAPLSGTLSNNVSSTAETADSNLANNDGSATNAQVITTVIPIADVVTTQSGPTNVSPLTNYTYRVTVSNQGPCTASSVVVADTLDPMLTFVSASAGGTYLAGVVTWPALASLAPGTTADFTVTVRAPLSGSLTNLASSTAATTDPNPANNNGSAPPAKVVTVVSPLQIANTSFGASVQTLNWSHTVAPGSSRILVVGVSIDNPSTTVSAANFNNFLPLTFIGQAIGTQSKVAMYYLLNPPVGTYPVSITLAATAGIVGGAVSLNGVNQANPIAAFVGDIGTGTNASVTVASALGGVVIDTVAPKSPRRATFPGPKQTVEWNLSGAIYSGAGSSSYGAASVTPSWALDSAAAWAMGAVALRPATILADLTLTAIGPASVPATSNLTYTIAVTNLGSSTASNVVVSDVLPAGATFVSASGGGTNNAGVVTWPAVRTLASGARTNYAVTITVPSFGTLTNIVYGTSFTADPDPSNNNGTGEGNQVVTTVTPLADVATSVTGPGSVVAVTDFSYTVTVTNAGPSPASEVVVSNALPVGAIFGSASDGGTHDAGVVLWILAGLDSGAVTNLTVTVTAPAGGTLTNSVSSTAVTSDLNAANNNGSAPGAQVITTVSPQADVATTVTGPASALAASDFSYVITVANAGPSPAANVVVSNTLPFGATFVSASEGGSLNSGVVTWTLARLDSGAVTNFAVTVTAPADGMLINIAASTATTADLVPSNNNGSASDAQVLTTITPVADIATTVTGPSIAITNAAFSYTVTVANLGPSAATSVAVRDILPAGALFVTASGGGTHNQGEVTWSLASLESAAGTNFIVTVLAPAIGSLTNAVSSSAVTGDPDASNNDGTTVAARVVTGVYPLLLLTGQQSPGDGFQVEFYTHPDTLVSIQASTNLVDWGTLITTNSGDGHVIFIDPDVASHPQRFYRSRQGP